MSRGLLELNGLGQRSTGGCLEYLLKNGAGGGRFHMYQANPTRLSLSLSHTL
jgi:hypothetical protein